jgi:hypothetical protein
MRDRIFVSYRRDDASAVAGRIADRLKHHFGEQSIFFDTSDLRVASAWSPAIDAALAGAAVLIAVIGPRWLDTRTSDGHRRLDLPDDVVRREVEVALRDSVPVIPLAVDGASFPSASDLPTPLRGLAGIQGDKVRRDQLTHSTFDDDMDRFLRNVSRIIAGQRGPTHDAWRRLQPKRRTSRLSDVARALLTNASIPPTITRRLVPDPFLRQDPYKDIGDYHDETPIASYLPYVEVKNWCGEIVAGRQPDIKVKILRGEFELESWGIGDGDAIRDEALAVALHEKPKTFNGPAVRVEAAAASDQTLWLTAQRARYFAQRRSNLALDYRFKTSSGSILTLRDLLRQQYGAHLPPLNDKRMANTLGVAALTLVRDGEELTPYLVSRAKDVAVFNCGGEWHCTASGVAEIEPDRPDREPYFYMDTMLKELDEEVGLLQHDLDFFEPVAFCREMTRAGKPQMFFLGVTSLDRATLRRKLTAARKRTREKGLVVENTAMPLWRRPSEITDEDALKLFHERGFTIEAAACLYYYFKCRSMA